ncbi:MAG: hypothetical protein COA74_03985 [Gammaproteobacteria bacterium]|nr:MAG: hypothetical protein COA74_03985 [Gammaproteobacteria bacterium]
MTIETSPSPLLLTTFDKEMAIQCYPHEMLHFEMEPALTDDTLIYLPKEENLFSGDIVFIKRTPVL